MARSRITITIPPDLLGAADRKADEMERSRSWLLSRALRTYLEKDAGGREGEADGRPGQADVADGVRERRDPYAPGLGARRQAQLEADLALSPEQRVALAEETARVAELRDGSPQRDRVITFERLEDFLEWERREALDW